MEMMKTPSAFAAELIETYGKEKAYSSFVVMLELRDCGPVPRSWVAAVVRHLAVSGVIL